MSRTAHLASELVAPVTCHLSWDSARVRLFWQTWRPRFLPVSVVMAVYFPLSMFFFDKVISRYSTLWEELYQSFKLENYLKSIKTV